MVRQYFIYLNNTEWPYNEKLRALNNHNARIKQRYYHNNPNHSIYRMRGKLEPLDDNTEEILQS